MTAFALALVLAAAFLHATWNFCAKRAGGGLPFVWLVGVVICACYLPVLTIYWTWKSPAPLSPAQLAWIGGSGVLKAAYALVLQRAYRSGEFSLIYPLARGTGPLLATLAAIALLGERPTPLAIAGASIIILAVFVLTGGTRLGRAILHAPPQPRLPNQAHVLEFPPTPGRHPLRLPLSYGLASGVLIAAYTIWDRQGVHRHAIPPVLYDAGTSFCVLALLSPFVISRWPEARRHWREHKRYVVGTALLSPLAYVLVLSAMTFTPVSYVAPAREVSIVIGAFIGARYLKETDGRRRIWAALAMSAGVIALALG